jgi:hypothetical protein
VLKSVRNASIAQRLTTNYVLRFPPNAISLAALPWEALWDKAKNQAVLIRGNTIDSCERYVDIDMAIPPPLPAGQQLRVLALSPSYGIPDEIRQEEQAARRKSWDKLKDAGKMVYDEISPLTIAALNDYLLDAPARPDVVHYFGHGIYRNGKGYLQFDDGKGGRDLVSAERLAAVLGDIRLIVIHACQSAMVDDDGGLLTGVAPALSIVTGAVVAMQLTIAIPAATRFSQVFYDQLLTRVRSLPGVKGAALTSDLFLSNTPNSGTFTLEDRPPFPPSEEIEATGDLVSPGFFETMQVRLVHGRFFDGSDKEGGPTTIVINETFANKYWPNQNPVGKRLVFGRPGPNNPWITVVGVAGDMRRRGLHRGARLEVFRSAGQFGGLWHADLFAA